MIATVLALERVPSAIYSPQACSPQALPLQASSTIMDWMDKYRFRRMIGRKPGLILLKIYKFLGTRMRDNIMGYDIEYDPNTEIGKSLYFNGSFEQNEILFCKNYIPSDGVVIDIGANIGVHSALYSSYARNGLVFSFEPAHDTFLYLLRNVRNLNNVIPLNMAVSDVTGIRELLVASDNAYSGLKDTKRKDIVCRYNVVSMRLDDILLSIGLTRIDFVKIDVEGLERTVLAGMAGIIEKYRPVIFCEIYQGENSNVDPEETVRFVTGKGYNTFVFDGNSLAEFTKHNDELYHYFFLPV